MTIVASSIQWPEDFKTYMDPATSPLSPYNNNYKSYIYGTFPLFLVKYVAEYFEMGDYQNLHLVGRNISAVVDLGSLLLIYFIGNNIYKKRLGLIAAALYAVTVLPIQQSHFFTTDGYETFFVLLCFALLVVFLKSRSVIMSSFISVFIGISFGLALGSKISSAVFGGIIVIALGMKFIKTVSKKTFFSEVFYLLDYAILIFPIAYIVFRLVQPYAFATGNWLDLTPQADFIAALNFQRSAIAGEVIFPPQYQWFNTTPFLFPLSNLLIWGIGIPIGIAAITGMIYFIYEQLLFLKTNYDFRRLAIPLSSPLLLAFIWIVFDFVYRGGSFVKTMRYFFAVVPFIIIFASYALIQLKKINKYLFIGAFSLVFVSSLIWSLAFVSIYNRTTTRIAASEWIYDNVPAGSIVANEHWDDGIPFRTDGTAPRTYTALELQVYNPDNEQKIQDLYNVLSQTDYVFVTSDRARKTIGELPEEFPIMTKYYQSLDNGSLGFELAHLESSYPQIFGIEINDSNAEEAFWVYDHPTVRIYKKVRQVNEQEFSCVLKQRENTWNGRFCDSISRTSN